MRGNLNIGHRHVLALYPALAVFAGSASVFFSFTILTFRRLGVVVCCGLLLWLLAISLWIWPHYLAYFNPIVGGPSQGYKHLVDSSLDWGQDLSGLARWLKNNPQTPPDKPVYLSYFGIANPQKEGLVDVINLKQLSFNKDFKALIDYLHPGRYCISATELQRIYNPMRGPWTSEKEISYQRLLPLAHIFFDRKIIPAPFEKIWDALGQEKIAVMMTDFGKLRFGRLLAYLRQRKPDAMIGFSILIFDLSQKEIDAALYGPAETLMP
jgi:hypothetical protein